MFPLLMFSSELVIYIMQFLTIYERVGLGVVSNDFRKLLTTHFGYDPFTRETEDWRQLGITVPRQRLGEEELARLSELATEAFEQICQSNLREIGPVGVGVACEALVELSNTTIAPTGKSMLKVNCLAQLKVGDKTLRAVNFIAYKNKESAVTMLRELGVDTTGVNYKLSTHRHAEMRLIMKLADQPVGTSANLEIDKLCCVFCASQLVALGYKNLIGGWAAGSLQWYTFSPITMFFTDRRAKIWGNEIEASFSVLEPPCKLHFLKLLADRAKESVAPLPEVKAISPAVIVPSGSASAPSHAPVRRPTAPSYNPYAPECPQCNAPMVRRKGYSSFWGCSAYGLTKCPGKRPA